ncbi:MAG: DUF4870 domain-containing protein [Flavobacterium sp.]
METKNEKTTAAITHLSTFSQYFIPFGNFIFPIIIWSSKKDKSEFIDYHGKQIINFQFSLMLYCIICLLVAIPTLMTAFFTDQNWNELVYNRDTFWESINFVNNRELFIIGIISLLMILVLKIIEFFLIIIAAVNASNGEKYKYPLTINFIK